MTKSDLARKIHEKIGITQREASKHVESLLSLIKETLEAGERVKISGFGVFEIKQKKNRRGRNPQTGESITIEARKVLTFKPSNMLRDSLNS